MSAFVLNRSYGLQLPNSFVDVDRDEMEYVDGGYSASYGTLWGLKCYDIRLNGAETSQFLSDAGWAALIICGATGIFSGVAAGIVGVILGVYGLTMSRYNSNGSGVTLKIPLFSSIPPQVWDNY